MKRVPIYVGIEHNQFCLAKMSSWLTCFDRILPEAFQWIDLATYR